MEYGNVPGMLRLDKTGLVRDYENYLVEEERSRNTITKYMRDLKSYFVFLQGEVHPSGKSSRGKAELPSCPYSADNLCHGHPCFGAAVYHAGNSQDRADCGGLQRKETYGFSARCIKPSSAGILPGAWNQRRRCVSHKKQKTS